MTATDGIIQVLVGALSGGGVGAVASWLAAKARAAGKSKRAEAQLAASVVAHEVESRRALWERVETLEQRCEERDDRIGELESHVRQCESALGESQRLSRECELRSEALEAEMAELRDEVRSHSPRGDSK